MNLVKNETFKMWILGKERFSKCEFLEKIKDFLPQCAYYNQNDGSAIVLKLQQKSIVLFRNSLDEMDALAIHQIQYQIHHSIQELRFQLTKGSRNLAAKKKKAYFRTITGTLLYELSVLLGVKSGSFIPSIKGHLWIPACV